LGTHAKFPLLAVWVIPNGQGHAGTPRQQAIQSTDDPITGSCSFSNSSARTPRL